MSEIESNSSTANVVGPVAKVTAAETTAPTNPTGHPRHSKSQRKQLRWLAKVDQEVQRQRAAEKSAASSSKEISKEKKSKRKRDDQQDPVGPSDSNGNSSSRNLSESQKKKSRSSRSSNSDESDKSGGDDAEMWNDPEISDLILKYGDPFVPHWTDTLPDYLKEAKDYYQSRHGKEINPIKQSANNFGMNQLSNNIHFVSNAKVPTLESLDNAAILRWIDAIKALKGTGGLGNVNIASAINPKLYPDLRWEFGSKLGRDGKPWISQSNKDAWMKWPDNTLFNKLKSVYPAPTAPEGSSLFHAVQKMPIKFTNTTMWKVMTKYVLP